MDENTERALKAFKAAQVSAAFKAKQVEPSCEDCPDPETAAGKGDVTFHGNAVLLGVPSGDGRMIDKGALTWDLSVEAVPILWDRDDGDHSGMVLGALDTVEDIGDALFVTGRLFASEDPIVQAAVARVVELISENAIGWSIMLDDESIMLTIKDPKIMEQDGATVVMIDRNDEMLTVTSGRLRHLALVDTPAFPGARPILGPPPALAAAAAVAVYPAQHFAKWDSRDPVPLQTDPDGRIWGHAAGDGCFRNGGGQCQKYQRDPDPKMSNFHTGTVTLDSGEVIRTGVLTAAGLHADVRNPTLEAQRQHHENSTTVYAKVIAWEDSRGRLCISGSMVPGLDPTFTAQVAGLPISTEKWPVAGVSGLTLVGAHAVPTPAWPVGV